jgi:hypothetical protein
MTVAIPNVEASEATVNVASELTSERIRHGAELSRNLRVSKASKQAGASLTLCCWTSAVSLSMVPEGRCSGE